jgi:site-specific DNA-cytosine methylase
VADRSEPIYGIGICGGALGLELGLEVAIPGYRSVCVVEREIAVAGRIAQRIREGSIPQLAWWDDVVTFDGRPWRGIISVLSAGFPCQPFSVAGKRKGKEDERWIWPDIARVIEVLGDQLEIVFLENVPGLLLATDSDFDRWDLEESSTDAIGGFGTVLSDLARLGFDAEWLCLRASDVGASHGRKRVFILAYRNGARLGRYAWQYDGGSPLQAARFGECGGSVVNAQHSDRRTQHEEYAYAYGQTGFGRPSDFVGNTDEPGYEVRGDDSGLRECAASERTGGAMGNPASDEQRREWERADRREGPDRRSSGDVGNPDGLRSIARSQNGGSRNPDCEPSGNVEHPTRSREHGLNGEAGRIGRRGVLETGEQLGDSESGGRGELWKSSEWGIGLADGSDPDVEHAARATSARFEQQRDILLGSADIFAPGPGFPGWKDLLVRYPWLRPSYSQAEAESDLRDVADGMAALVVRERTGALRALGNGVVPLQSAVAFTVLLGRVIEARLLVERSEVDAQRTAE